MMMKTDELVAMLATQAAPVESNTGAHRFSLALGWGLFVTALMMAIMLGVRPDIFDALLLPMFWVKLVFPASLAVAAVYGAMRLARPGARLGRAPAVAAALIAAVWLLALVALLNTVPGERRQLIFGDTWLFCLINIPLLSLPVFISAVWAMKGLAPTRLPLAGGAAGLLAGAAGAAVYALHCPEMAPPFLAIWYVLGMLIPALIGVVLGPRLLRW